MKKYTHYVVCGDKITSGWPCQSDAKEAANETRENGHQCIVSAYSTLIKRGIAPTQQKFWCNEHELPRTGSVKLEKSAKLKKNPERNFTEIVEIFDKFEQDFLKSIAIVLNKYNLYEQPDIVLILQKYIPEILKEIGKSKGVRNIKCL